MFLSKEVVHFNCNQSPRIHLIMNVIELFNFNRIHFSKEALNPKLKHSTNLKSHFKSLAKAQNSIIQPRVVDHVVSE